MKTLFKYFAKGLLFLIPLAATIYVVYWTFTTVGGTVWRLIEKNVSVTLPGFLEYVLGCVITLVVITGIGVLSSLFITRPLMQLVEKIFARLPLISLLYSSIKDLIGAFVGDKKKFNRPVIVQISATGIKALGFVTRPAIEFIDQPGQVAVYFPQSYNFAGNVLIVPNDKVTALDVDSSEVMAFIVSGGVTGDTKAEEAKTDESQA